MEAVTLTAPEIQSAEFNPHQIDGMWCVMDLKGNVVIDNLALEETAVGMADLLNGDDHSEDIIDIWNQYLS